MSSSRTARAAPAGRRPIFGVEIEIFVRLKPSVEEWILCKRRNGDPLPYHWRHWDNTLLNNSSDRSRKSAQRALVGSAIKELISQELGSQDLGWSCEPDASLNEEKLTVPPDPRKWWGIEIISPPMSVSRHWQQEIEQVFEAIGQYFNFWTTDQTSCHVHVSPGPNKSSEYTMDQLINVAKGAYFWETALLDLLPADRKHTGWALPNYTTYATKEYYAVPYDGWKPVFKKLDKLGEQDVTKLVLTMAGKDVLGEPTRYISHSFHPLLRLGTIEFRRQAGVASAETAIHRALLAVTLHISARRYDFKGAQSRKSYPSSDELIKELAGCIKALPETCHGSQFVSWLKQCVTDYGNGRKFTEKQTNDRESALRPSSIRGIEPATPGTVQHDPALHANTQSTSSSSRGANTVEVAARGQSSSTSSRRANTIEAASRGTSSRTAQSTSSSSRGANTVEATTRGTSSRTAQSTSSSSRGANIVEARPGDVSYAPTYTESDISWSTLPR
ncbi:hypothetical protein C8A03DRAFT_16829 [Achaetomium macrosporum]|uniref:Uncharacterized protein n=1 Tax=Achaetomium macrosporum TaxID=79813 RepID=A0AAN7C7N8_9PEZI|nr:hypothetical protein C8A03DRAFT_16829 [Achaetomium macrosporum]